MYYYKGYILKPSTRKNKKYDAFDKEGNKIASFGELRKKDGTFYEHYHDRFGYYSNLDHLDERRRINFWKRHKKTSDKNSARYWLKFLW